MNNVIKNTSVEIFVDTVLSLLWLYESKLVLYWIVKELQTISKTSYIFLYFPQNKKFSLIKVPTLQHE